MNYLIYGNSYNLIDAEIKKIIGDKKSETFYLDEMDLGSILEDISYTSMFDEEKILILKNFDVLSTGGKSNDEMLEKLEKYLGSPLENTTLIFVSSTKISSSRGSLKKIVSKLKVIETPIFTKSYELAKALEKVIRSEGYAISASSLDTFIEKCAINYDVALNEFNKLKRAKGKDKLITDKDIEEYVSNYNTNDLFGFKDAVVNRNVEKANKMLDDLESSKMEIIPLVVMLAKEYQSIYNVKLLSEKKLSNEQIGKELNNMHPYRVKLLREASLKYSNKELECLILELCNMDLRLTSEDNLGFDELRKFLILL